MARTKQICDLSPRALFKLPGSNTVLRKVGNTHFVRAHPNATVEHSRCTTPILSLPAGIRTDVLPLIEPERVPA